jgi:peptide/nickel transport system permease protein
MIRLGYIVRRLGVFVLVVWVAATLSFLMPRLAPVNPIRTRLLQAVSFGGAAKTDMEKVVAYYEARFGLDQPLWKQYLRYLYDVARLDFGVSIANFPASVMTIILSALPWTLVLLTVSTLMAFTLGTLLGALLAWPKTPRAFQFLVAPLLTLSSIPYYLLGLVLVFFLAFTIRAFPLAGGYTLGKTPELSLSFLTDAAYHSILPAFSIVLAALGSWALGMRGMMVTILGEDYITLAEAKGLGGGRIFNRYALRNALLPQTTSLALSLGTVVSGAVLVEVVFGYPGVGTVLYRAIQTFDYFLIYGIVLMIIISIGLVTFVIDLVYPLLDPRISYRRR